MQDRDEILIEFHCNDCGATWRESADSIDPDHPPKCDCQQSREGYDYRDE